MPHRYRVLVWLAGLVSFAGLGVWAGVATPLPVMWAGGALLGALIGVGAVVAFLHSLDRAPMSGIGRSRRAG